MERKLATIRRIGEIKPIKNADNIELAVVDGWQCVVLKKDNFKKGDLAIYFEIDSFLPVEPRYEFLRNSSFKHHGDGSEGFKLKTITFRGEISQGLLLPLSTFPEIATANEGDDVTSLLGVKLYEPPIPVGLAGQLKSGFLYGIPKTDQERIQNLIKYFKEHYDTEFEVTEKMDGTSCTVYLNNGEFGIGSRRYFLMEDPKNVLWSMARKLKLEEILRAIGKNIAIQMEYIGNGINNNRYKLNGGNFCIFDIYDIDSRRYYTHKERVELVEKIIGMIDKENQKLIYHVPIVEVSKIFQKYPTIDEMLAFANGESHKFKGIRREGYVCKSVDGKVSFKIVSNSDLLKSA